MNTRERASEHFEAAEESFRRSDTDGFLSQWAHGLEGRRLHAQASIEENGGMSAFPALLEGEREVNAKIIDGKFGPVWLLADSEEARFGRRFIPVGERSRVQRELGLHEGEVDAPAKAVIRGGGRGLAGAASCHVVIVRTDLYDWETS